MNFLIIRQDSRYYSIENFQLLVTFFPLSARRRAQFMLIFLFFLIPLKSPPPHQHPPPPGGIPLNSVLELYLVPNALSYPNYEMGLFHILVLFSKYSSFAPIICMYAYIFICNRTDETYQLDYREMRDLCFYSMICKLH